jgi:biotin carboxylase
MPESEKRVLLFASKLGYQTRSFADAAKKLNVELVYVTDRCHQLDDPWEDRAIPAHFEKPVEAAQAVVEEVRPANVDGILALGDRPAHAAAFAARSLSIPFHHPAAVEACRSKLRAREVLRDAGLPVPWFRAIALEPIPEPALLGIKYPCVLKPLSLSASQGVIRANNREEFVAAATRIRRLLQTPEIQATREPRLNDIIVEGYLPGREVAVEALMTAGAIRVLAIFDKPDPLEGPYFEETIYVTPSRLGPRQITAIENSLRASATALGLSHGPVHAEFRVGDGVENGVWPIEIAPRPIG